MNFSTLVPDPGAAKLDAVNVAVTPVGNPLAARAIAALNPPLTVTVELRLAVPPAVKETVPAAGLNWNAGTALASAQ